MSQPTNEEIRKALGYHSSPTDRECDLLREVFGNSQRIFQPIEVSGKLETAPQDRLDMFAAAALTGIIGHGLECGNDVLAELAWEMALDMIEAYPATKQEETTA